MRRPPRSPPLYSSAASDVYKRQGPDGKKLVENSELNDEGRIAKLARRYKFDEHQLPWKDLNALGLDKETLFNNHCMGELLKGRITSTALPISKEINGEKKDLGEACFMLSLIHI